VGRVAEAQKLARRALDLVIELKLDRGRGASHYLLARVHAVAGRTDPQAITEAAKQLCRAFLAQPVFREGYQRDRRFDPVRARLDAAMPQADAEARAEVRRRRASAPMAQLAPTRRSPRADNMRLIPQEAQPE
jgi:hypothetical protein